jgi:CRP-like cAMP-binding protein
VVSGRVRLVEADLVVGPGELLGEIAFFSEAKERTLTAVCDTRCEIVSVDERAFMQLYHQNPAFGMYVVRLVARRLLDGMAKAPAAYLPVSEP